MELELLDSGYTRMMIEVILQGVASNELVEYVYRESGGNQYKLKLLEKEEREILETAACIGKDFEFELLKDVTETNEGKLYHILDELISIGMMKELEKNNRYYFQEDIFREFIYEEIPRVRRIELHRRIANSIERLVPDISYWFDQLTYYYRACGNREKLLNYSKKAGEKAKEIFANEEALKSFFWALESTEDEKERVEILRKMGEVSSIIGNYKNAIGYLEEAV